MISYQLLLLLCSMLGGLLGVLETQRLRAPRESHEDYLDRLERECEIGPYA